MSALLVLGAGLILWLAAFAFFTAVGNLLLWVFKR